MSKTKRYGEPTKDTNNPVLNDNSSLNFYKFLLTITLPKLLLESYLAYNKHIILCRIELWQSLTKHLNEREIRTSAGTLFLGVFIALIMIVLKAIFSL